MLSCFDLRERANFGKHPFGTRFTKLYVLNPVTLVRHDDHLCCDEEGEEAPTDLVIAIRARETARDLIRTPLLGPRQGHHRVALGIANRGESHGNAPQRSDHRDYQGDGTRP